jgi:hypothetical protein
LVTFDGGTAGSSDVYVGFTQNEIVTITVFADLIELLTGGFILTWSTRVAEIGIHNRTR